MKTKISMIAVIGKNRELGKDNRIPWYIPEDMKRFKNLTKGHVVIMGRNTFESIGRPLPDRINIVITHDTQYNPPGCIVVHSLGEAIQKAENAVIARSETTKQSQKKDRHASLAMTSNEIFIIGGGQVYKQAMPFADKLYLTLIDGIFDADTFFPDYEEFKNV